MARRVGQVAAGLVLLAIVEIVLLVLVAHWVGVAWTVLLVLAGTLLGGLLLRREGLRAWQAWQAAGQAAHPLGQPAGWGLPGLAAGLLLVVPGFLSDAAGLALLVPPVRRLAGRGMRRLALRWMPPALAGDLVGPRRVRVRRPGRYRPAPGGGDVPIVEGDIVDEPAG